MLFKQEMLDKVLAGEKTVTRRPVKYNKSGKYLPARYKVGGGPGGTYALRGPPEKGSKARATTVPGYRLRVLDRKIVRLGDITFGEAQLEGFEDRYAFWRYWLKLYGELDFKQKVWRYEFELGEGIEIRRTSSIANGQPYLAEGAGVRVVDIIDRIRGGDSELDVAKDFGVKLESVRLLVDMAEAVGE